MSKIRVVVAEIEGASDSVLMEAIRRFGAVGVETAAPVTLAALVLEVAAPAPLLEPKMARRKPERKAAKIRAEEKTPTVSGAETCLMELLAKRPMTTADLITASRLTSPSVYTALTVMRKRAVIVSREDPADGYRKNWLLNK